MIYLLDTLVHGAGPGNHGADFATFRPSYAPFELSAPGSAGKGTFQLSTADWIKRGRPVQIEINLPEVVA